MAYIPSWSFPRYVSATERRARAERARRRFDPADSVRPAGRGNKIATTFWGQAWCRNLEQYSDFANRLPRGRSYLRSGSVLRLAIERGRVEAQVQGRSLYSVKVDIQPLRPERWSALKAECAGRIESLVALLKGSLPDHVMSVVTQPKTGLFPSPAEIGLDCSCPDWATLCKHVAAVLYGVGVRLDSQPRLLFELRGVDETELVQGAPALWDSRGTPAEARLEGDISALFGIELEDEAGARETKATEETKTTPPRPARPATAPRRRPRKRRAPRAEPVSIKTGDRVSRGQLRALGAGAATVHAWLVDGILLPTGQASVFVTTAETAPALRKHKASRRG